MRVASSCLALVQVSNVPDTAGACVAAAKMFLGAPLGTPPHWQQKRSTNRTSFPQPQVALEETHVVYAFKRHDWRGGGGLRLLSGQAGAKNIDPSSPKFNRTVMPRCVRLEGDQDLVIHHLKSRATRSPSPFQDSQGSRC